MRLLFALAAAALTLPTHAQLSSDIARIAAQAHGRVGVACALPGRTLDCNFRAADSLPMQSVYKLPIAMAAFHAVEQGHFTLTRKIRFLPSDMGAPDEYSPLRTAHPQANVDVSVKELLERDVTQSDNVACDILLRVLGGPAAATAYISGLDIQGINIVDDEKSVDRNEQLQYRNSAPPLALVALLRILADRSPLSPEHTQLLMAWMRASHTGDQRIRALLPAGTVVADKTGTAGQNRPVTNATNDIGLVTLPSGKTLAIAILIADSHAPFAVRERVIAQIAKAIYDASQITGH